MATPKILIKRSNVAGRVPTSLDSGELALNTADGKIYYTGHDGAIHAFIDSAGVNTLINNSVSTLDSGNVTDMIDSDYIQARQITYTIPTLGNDFVDSAQVQAIINAAYVKNIIDSAYVAGIVETDGDITITITNEITSTVDSAYVQARVDATDFLDSAEAIALIDSAHVRGKIDTTFINSLNVNSTTLDGQNGDHYLDYNNFTNTPTILDNIDVQNQIDSDYVQLRQEKFDTSDFTDSAYVKARIDSAISDLIGGAPEALNTLNELAEALNDDSAAYDTLLAQIDARLDSAEATALIDSAYIRARQIKYLDSDAVKLITLDSSEIPTVVTEAYVRARQDFRYNQLTGAPGALSELTNDLFSSTDDLGEGSTNLYYTTARTESDAGAFIDSAYINARVNSVDAGMGFDSDDIKQIGDDRYLRSDGDSLNGDLFVGSQKKIYLGDSDAYIEGNANSSQATIRNSGGSVRIQSNDIQLNTTGNIGIISTTNTTASLRYSGSTKLSTKSDGVTITGKINQLTLPTGTKTLATTDDVFSGDYDDLTNKPTLPTLGTDFVDSGQVEAIVDSAYVQLRQTAQDFAYSSLTGKPALIDSALTTQLIDSAYVQARETAQDFAYSSLTGAPTIPALGTDFVDSGQVEAIVDSAYVQLRQTAQDFAYSSLTGAPTIPVLGTDFIDSAEALKLIDANALDSNRAISLIDSAYVQARQTDIRDSAFVTGIIDSAYIKARDRFRDSAFITSIIDSAYIQLRDRFRDSAFITSIIDSDYITARDRQRDSNFVTALVDSAYIQLRDRFQDSSLVTSTVTQSYVRNLETPNPVLGTDFVDSAEALKLIDANALDSGRATSLIDSAYVQLRQDYAYGSLTGTPTIPAFGTDYVDSSYVDGVLPKFGTDYVDSAFVTGQGYITSADLPVLGTDFVDSAEANTLINAIVDSNGLNFIRVKSGDTVEPVVSGHSGIGIGNDARSTGVYGTAIGYRPEATSYSVAIGGVDPKAQALFSVAIGDRAKTSTGHDYSVALGKAAETTASNQIMLGAKDNSLFRTTSVRIGNPHYEPTDSMDVPTKKYVDSQITTVIDSAYITSRETAQDFAYSSLTGAPTIPALGTDFVDSAEALKLIDANALDSARAISLIDSAYIQARQVDLQRDSAFVTGIIDSDYVRLQTRIGDSDIDFGSHKIRYSNVYSAEADLPDASTYHGMFAHVHATGAGYFAHGGNWIRLANQSEIFDGAYGSLTGTPTIPVLGTDFIDSAEALKLIPVLGTDFIDSAEALKLIDANALDSGRATTLIDSAYVQARQTAGTDSAATIALIESTVDSAYVQLRQTSGGGGGGTLDSATVIALIDSQYIIDRVDSDYEKPINQVTFVYTADSGQTAFVDSDDNGTIMSFTADQQITVYLNGLLLTGTSDVSVTPSTNTVTLTEAADSGDIVTVVKLSGAKPHIDSALVESIVNNASLSITTYKYTATASQTVFSGADDNNSTLQYQAGHIRVSTNGILLIDSDDYTATNGTSVTLLTSANLNDIITIEKFAGRDVGLDSTGVANLIDSAYVQARQITYTIPTFGTDFIDSAEAIRLITANAIDSGVALELLLDSIETIALIDSAYVQERQDYAYASLTGTPTIPAFGTDYVDSAFVTGQLPVLGTDFVDSAQALILIDANALDSGRATSLIDSAYVQNRIDFSNTSANEIIAMNANNNGFVASGMIYNSSTQSLGIGVDSAGSIDARLHIVGSGTANTGETLFKVNNTDDHDRIEFIDERSDSQMPASLRNRLATYGIGIISNSGAVKLFSGGSSPSNIVVEADTSGVTFNDAYKFPTADGTSGQFLKTNGEGVLSFDSVAAGQSLALGTDYVDSAQVELIIDSSYVRGKIAPTFTFGSNDSATVSDLQVTNQLKLGGSGSQFFAFNEDTVKVKFANWYSSNAQQYGMGMLWYETWFGAIDNTGFGPEQRRIGFYLEEPDAGATDADGGTGKHPSNARMYISDSGMHVSYSNPFRLNESGGPNYIELAGAQTLASNVTLTLPTTTGTLARTADLPVLGTDFIDSAQALILIDANALDSGRVTSLIDSAYPIAFAGGGIYNTRPSVLNDSVYGTGGGIAIGWSAKADYSAIAIGTNADARNPDGDFGLAEYSIAMGRNSRADKKSGTALGHQAQVYDSGGTAVGHSAYAWGTGSVSIGEGGRARETGTIAVGPSADASKIYSVAIGYAAIATDSNQMMLGYTNNTYGLRSIRVGNPDYDPSHDQDLVTKGYVDSQITLSAGIDSAEALKLIDANALDSGRATSLIDSDYIKLRTRIGDSDIDFGSNKILYSNVYSAEGDLPSASTYHGMFAHVHGTGAGYFAHGGNWIRLANQSEIFDGAYGSLTGTPTIPALGTDFIDSAQALILIDANALDSGRAISLIDSAYVQARTTAGTDSSATIALIEATVDSAYVQLREAAGGGGSGTLDSASAIDLIDSAYVQARQNSSTGLDSAGTLALINDTHLTVTTYVYTADSAGHLAYEGADDNGAILALSSASKNYRVSLNGILLLDSDDFTATDTKITLTSNVTTSDILTVETFKGRHVAGGINSYRFTPSAGTTTITGEDVKGKTLNYSEDQVQVFLNGIALIDSADFTATSGTSIVLDTATAAGDEILIQNFIPSSERIWTEIASDVAVGSNTKNIVNVSGNSVTLTFPSNPTFGDEIRVIDGFGNAATNNIVINRNGNKIQGAADDFRIDVNRAAVGFVYYNATQGWILIEN